MQTGGDGILKEDRERDKDRDRDRGAQTRARLRLAVKAWRLQTEDATEGRLSRIDGFMENRIMDHGTRNASRKVPQRRINDYFSERRGTFTGWTGWRSEG
jgi:hypothetical protein